MLGIVDYETHFMGDWNGTGACTSHHGSQCCYTDAANLVAAHVADQAKAWSFVHCMFSNQKSLCPKTWDDDKEECGTEDHDDATFQAVKASCTASAKFSDDELKAFDAALGTLSAGDWVHDALVADYAFTTNNNPGAPHPGWSVVNGEFLDSGKYAPDGVEWAADVVSKICAAYAGDTKPAACEQQ